MFYLKLGLIIQLTIFISPNFIATSSYKVFPFPNVTECTNEFNTDYKLDKKNRARCVDDEYNVLECPKNLCTRWPPEQLNLGNWKQNKWDHLKFVGCRKFLGKWGDSNNLDEKKVDIKVLRFWDHYQTGFMNVVSLDQKTKKEVGYHCPWQGQDHPNDNRPYCISCSIVKSKASPKPPPGGQNKNRVTGVKTDYVKVL